MTETSRSQLPAKNIMCKHCDITGLPDWLLWRQLTNLAFFKHLASKKIVWLFGLFFSIFGFFRGSWHILSDWCFGFSNVLLKVLLRLVYFLKSYLEIHERIKL